jgi:uncharacterized phage protein (TIGR02220 family)
MENSQGWIKLHRQIMETPEWLAEPFTRGQAWVDLLLLANHKPGFIRRRGIMVMVERGQVGYSVESLAERWKWSKGKVLRFFQELITLERICRKTAGTCENTAGRGLLQGKIRKIVPKKTSVSSLIHIVNYERYQADRTENRTEDRTEDGTGTIMKRIRRNNISPKAEEVISYLNQKTGKQYKNTKFIQARLNEGRTVDDCKRVINVKIADPYFIQNPKFLNPETLFRPNHFDCYLNESVSTLPDLKEEKTKSTSTSICPRCHAQIPPQDRFGEGCIRCETLEARA